LVTVNAKLRRPVLCQPDAAATILAAWREAGAWAVGRYVIMPDHIHLFAAPVDPKVPIEDWVRFWKSRSASRWPRPCERPVWQRHFWDTQIRAWESYDQTWEYVRWNPVRRQLVARPEDWPHAGELHVLDWREG
jgi:REP element-mobilizing transposase RayT